MQKQIKKLFVNDINTKYGAKKKYDIYIDGTNGEFKFSSWVGKWNELWAIGSSIEVPDISDNRWKKSEYQGRTSYTLGAPPETMQQGGGNYTPQAQTAPQQAPVAPQAMPTVNTEELERRLTDLEKKVAILSLNQVEKEISDEEIPVVGGEEKIDISEVPF